MSEPPDDHTLNACLARVIGVEVRDRLQDFILPKWVSVKTGEYWDPLHNASQMEEVEAWLKQQGIEFVITSAHLCNLMIVELILANGIFEGKDPDKKRALALAIYQMEQAQKETT